MATYFQATNGDNKVIIDDVTSYMRVTRKLSLAQGARKIRAGVYSITLQSYEYALAFKLGQVSNTIVCSAYRVGLQEIWMFFADSDAATTAPMTNDIPTSLLNDTILYFIGDERTAEAGFGLEIRNDNNEVIYRATDSMVDVVTPILDTAQAHNIKTDAPYDWIADITTSWSTGYAWENRAVIVNNLISTVTGYSASYPVPIIVNYGLVNIGGAIIVAAGFWSLSERYSPIRVCARQDLLLIDTSKVY